MTHFTVALHEAIAMQTIRRSEKRAEIEKRQVELGYIPAHSSQRALHNRLLEAKRPCPWPRLRAVGGDGGSSMSEHERACGRKMI